MKNYPAGYKGDDMSSVNSMFGMNLDKASFIAKQTREAKDERPFIRCGCMKKVWLIHAYRCLYCGEWYCKECAEQHFGKTVAEYKVEKISQGDNNE